MRVTLLGGVTASSDGRGRDLLPKLPPQPRLFLAILAEEPGQWVVAAVVPRPAAGATCATGPLLTSISDRSRLSSSESSVGVPPGASTPSR